LKFKFKLALKYVCTRVGHAQKSSRTMFNVEVFIFEG